ncbi:helix-turn-helix domain-containing protein [Pseudoalteromonas sp. T1lg24]|uniref:helix-turn-helix domain-containing protein n=1 Tax=Pseudoalteromonas sp. T1lg24 TaxID=2077099 RepID=UPI000CF72BE8|nr:helix-turn-helix transcriptional regulator [Pseudoalteromonas sp. T1lg24]
MSKNFDEALAKLIGRNIKMLRFDKGLNQEFVCEKAGIDRSYLSRIENGKTQVTASIIYSIAIALDCEVTDIFPNVSDIPLT